MESSIRVEKTHFLQQDEYDNDNDDDHDSLTTTMTKCSSSSRSTAELAFESSLQASFAEKTALEMKELMDYWKATVTTPTPVTATCNMPHNSLTVLAEEEQEEEEAGSIMKDHDDKEDTASAKSSDHDDADDDNDTVDSSYSGPLEQQQQRNQAPQMPPRHVLFSRERRISTSSNLTCVTNLLPDDDGLGEFSFSLHSKGGNKQLCDNASTTTASTHMMSSTYSCDTSTISVSCSSSASCCHHQLAFFPPLSTTTTTTCTTASNCGAGHYPVVFWSDDNHSMIHTTTLPTGGEKEDYTPVILQAPPFLLVSHQCDASEASSPSSSSALAVEHFRWTACQQQTLVNMACSRAQWMADSLAALLLNHDNRSLDDAPASTSCNRNALQQPLLLLLQLFKKRVHLQLRLACGRIANELYIGFCQALPLEYLRLWVYLWHLIHSYLPETTDDNNVVTSYDNFAKKTLKRDLIMASLFILVIAVKVRIQASLLQQPQHDDTPPCLVCFQPDATLLSQPSSSAAATILPFRSLYFETVHYSGLPSSSSGQDVLLLL